MEELAPESVRAFTPQHSTTGRCPLCAGEPPERTSGTGASVGSRVLEAGAGVRSRSWDRSEGTSPSAAPRTLSPKPATAAGALLDCPECKSRGFCRLLPRAPQDGGNPGLWLRVTQVPFLAPEGAAPPQILGQVAGGQGSVVVTSTLPLRC